MIRATHTLLPPRVRTWTAALLSTLVLGAVAPAIGSAPASAQSPSSTVSVPTAPQLGAPPTDATVLGIGAPVSVVLVEVATGQILVAGDADVRRPIASAVKLLTALAVVDALPPGSAVTVAEGLAEIEGSSYGLVAGEVRSVEDLLAGLLLRSGNDVAVALAVAIDGSEAAFVDRMADTLAGLGIDARPATASGLDTADALSASELAVVSRAALAEPRIRDLVALPELEVEGAEPIENRNLFLLDVEGATGLKTGFTNAAGFTLAASAEREGRALVAVVLGAADDRERRDLAARLIEHGYAATDLLTLRRSVTLRTSSGPVRLATVDTRMTLAEGMTVVPDWPASLRPDDQPTSVELRVGREDGSSVSAGPVEIMRLDGRREPGSGSLGRALADGVYAALRPYGLADALR